MTCKFALLTFGLLLSTIGTHFVDASTTETVTTIAPHRNSNAHRWNRQNPTTAAPHACEYKEILANLHDRVGVLATIDEDLRNRLESIDKKISQFDESNAARLESLGAQQMDFLKRVELLELLERMTKREVEELKEEIVKSRETREVSPTESIEPFSFTRTGTIDDSRKLDALSILLTSTASAVNNLRNELQSNITRLVQTTSNLNRRLNNLQRRQQNGYNVQQHYGPPLPPPNFYAPPISPQQSLITSCAQGAPTANGILRLQLTETSVPFYVRCDEQYKNGGWTIILNRFIGDVNFQRDWTEYKNGFGNLAGDFFIGLEKLHALTSYAVHELAIVLEDFENAQRSARYDLFAIGNEAESYALSLLGNYTGTAGDSLTYHAGSKFSTYDNDNDGCLDCNCAQAHMGAWWYNWCEQSNLFGKYFTENFNNTPTYQGMYWHHWLGPNYSLRAARMMIRPVITDAETERR